MRLTLEEKWTARLLHLPESGMGFQRVRVHLKDGRTVNDATVLNAQVLQVADDVGPVTTADIVDIELEPAK